MFVHVDNGDVGILDEVLDYAKDNLDMDNMEAVKIINNIQEQLKNRCVVCKNELSYSADSNVCTGCSEKIPC